VPNITVEIGAVAIGVHEWAGPLTLCSFLTTKYSLFTA
jgi:hypothetical protein